MISIPILSRAKSYAWAIFSLTAEQRHAVSDRAACSRAAPGRRVVLLVAGELSFGLSDIGEVAFPQVDVQHLHEAPLKQLDRQEHLDSRAKTQMLSCRFRASRTPHDERHAYLMWQDYNCVWPELVCQIKEGALHNVIREAHISAD